MSAASNLAASIEAMADPRMLYVAGLVLGSAAVVALLSLQRPAVNRRTVLALVPWMVSGALLDALYGTDVYPATVAPVAAPGAYLTVFVIAGLAWVVLLQLSVDDDSLHGLPEYLGAMGIGIATVLVAFALVLGGPLNHLELAWLFIFPVVSAVVAVAVWFGLGLLDTDAVAYTGLAGALLVFGQVFDGLSTTIGVGAVGPAAHTALSRAAANAAPALGWGQVGPWIAWVGLFVWLKLAVAVGTIVLLSRLVRRRPRFGNLLLALVAAAGIVPGVNHLFTFVLTQP